MSTSQKINKVSNRHERTNYTGRFNDFQTFGNSFKGKKYNQYEKDPYNKYQNLLYKRALFGLKAYSLEELESMHPEKKARVQKVNSRTQYELNIWKQEQIIKITNKIFSRFGKSVLNGLYSKPDPKFISKTSFKDLGISKEDIICRLVSKKILPQNFQNL